jgi:hypothetical protein
MAYSIFFCRLIWTGGEEKEIRRQSLHYSRF